MVLFLLILRDEDDITAFSNPFFANSFGDNPNRKIPNDDDDNGFFTFVVGENIALRVGAVLQSSSSASSSMIGAQKVEFRNVPVDRTRCGGFFLLLSTTTNPRRESDDVDEAAGEDDDANEELVLLAAAFVAALGGLVILFDLPRRLVRVGRLLRPIMVAVGFATGAVVTLPLPVVPVVEVVSVECNDEDMTEFFLLFV